MLATASCKITTKIMTLLSWVRSLFIWTLTQTALRPVIHRSRIYEWGRKTRHFSSSLWENHVEDISQTRACSYFRMCLEGNFNAHQTKNEGSQTHRVPQKQSTSVQNFAIIVKKQSSSPLTKKQCRELIAIHRMHLQKMSCRAGGTQKWTFKRKAEEAERETRRVHMHMNRHATQD